MLTTIVAVALALAAPGCREKPPEERKLYFGIPVIVRFDPRDDGLAAEVWRYLEGVDDVFNDFRAESEVGRANASRGGERLAVSDDLAQALRLSREVNGLTGGAFDVTVGAVRDLWREAGKAGAPPSDAGIASALASCGMDKVNLDGNTLVVRAPGLRLDFGGIVKGIAVDRAVAMLKAGGARSGLVQIGGETAAWGTSRRGRPHVVGVQHPLFPRLPGRPARLWTAVADPGAGISVATSGNYQQPVVIGDTVYYHIFDPRTGRPVDTRTLSVTVAFRETGRNGLADGLSTAGAVLGWEKAIPLVEKLGGEALFVVATREGVREFRSKGWDALVAGGE